ncbi:MAG: protoporphyrinogen oxidase, partial [Acidobacteriota bacterium]
MAVGQLAPVVVIGGGIAGLTAAYRLSRAAPGVQLTLIEQEPRLGGKIVTERTRGFVIEGGPDCFLAYKPAGVALCRELGLGDRLIGTSERGKRAYVMCGGRLYALPDGFTGLVPSRLLPMAATPLLSPLGKLRAGIEYFIPPCREACDESLAGFVTRRLGRETYDRILEPLLGGICAGDGEQLSLEAIFPQLSRMEREHGGLFRAMRQMRREARRTSTRSEGAPAEKKGSPFLTTPTGLAELVEALERGLQGARLLAGRRAVRVSA